MNGHMKWSGSLKMLTVHMIVDGKMTRPYNEKKAYTTQCFSYSIIVTNYKMHCKWTEWHTDLSSAVPDLLRAPP